MFKNAGYNLSDIAAVTRNGNGNGFGEDGWWIILLFLFSGWGRGGSYESGSCATQADVRAAVDQQTLISKLDQQTYGLADSTYALNSSLTNGFHGVDSAICNLGYNFQGGLNTLAHQISDCCCSTQRALENGFSTLNYNLATQSCDTRRAISDSTRDIIDGQNAGVRAILDFLTQDKIASLTAENQSLKFAANQAAQNDFIAANASAQTAEILRRLGTPAPMPAYVVPNPNCCYNIPNLFNFGCGGCGC